MSDLIIDQYKYTTCCSRCGEQFLSLMEILDIIPIICGKCHIDMPINFTTNCQEIKKENIDEN